MFITLLIGWLVCGVWVSGYLYAYYRSCNSILVPRKVDTLFALLSVFGGPLNAAEAWHYRAAGFRWILPGWRT